MAEKKEVDVSSKKNDAKFIKEQLINSDRYSGKRDLLNALLSDGTYTIKEVDKLIKDYLESEVK